MTIEQFTNNASSVLTAAITSGATTLTVSSASAFPTAGNFRILIDNEIMLVTAVSSNTFTVTRGQESTTAAAHTANATAAHIITAASYTQGISDRFIGIQNHLDNGSFGPASRQVPGTFSTPIFGNTAASAGGIDGYGADRWKVSMQSATTQYKRVDTVGAREVGIVERFYGQYNQATGAGKFFIYQPIEGSYTYALGGQQVTFQINMKASSSKTIRIGLVQLTSSGTLDTIPGLIVPTTWGATSTDPTLGSNLSYITPDSVPTGGNTTIASSALNCSVTTAWQQFAGTFTVPSTAKNLLACIWTDAQFSVSDTLSTSQAGVFLGATVTPWIPVPPQVALARTQRYIVGFGSLTASTDRIGVGLATTTSAGQASIIVPQLMFRIPTPGYSSIGHLGAYDGSAITALTSLSNDSGSSGRVPQVDYGVAGTPFTQFRYQQLLINSSSGLFWLDADL